MTEITALAVNYKDLLRWCAANSPQPAAAIAAGTGRVPSNVKRDLPKLIEAGLMLEENGLFGLSEDGYDTVKAFDLAEGRTNAVREGGEDAAPEGFIWLTHAEIRADPNNARKDFDEEALRELADSMAEKGLLQKPAVRRVEGADGAQLVAGERRWRAWGMNIDRGVWSADRRELCTLVEGDEAHVEEAGLIENLQRKDLKPLEEARGFRRLIDSHGHTTATIAEKVGFTQRFVQQRLQLLDLKPDDMKALDAGRITIEDARKRIANYPKPFELTPEQLLVFLEIAHRHAKLGLDIGYGKQAPVGCAMTSDEHAKALMPLGILGTTKDYDTCIHSVYLYWASNRALVQYTGVDSPELDAIAEPLAKSREALGVTAPDGAAYVTSWLNEPYEADPEELATRKANVAHWEKQNAEQAAERAARAEAQRAQEAGDVALLAEIRTLEAELAAMTPEDARPAFAAFLTAHNKPAPYSARYIRLSPQGAFEAVAHDANGVANVGGPRFVEGLRRLSAMAMNLACDLPVAVSDWDAPDAELERPAFEAAMTARLRELYEDETEEDAAKRAAELLDGFLADNHIAYGDDGWTWNKEAAEELTDDLDAEDMQAGEEAEEARMMGEDDQGETVSDVLDATPADDELPESLTRLAGVPAEADA